MNDEPHLLTADIPQFLRERRGIKVSLSSLQKLVAPSVDQGPPIAARWGRRALFRREDVLAWADRKLQESMEQKQSGC